MTIYLDCLLALIGAVTLWTFWPQFRWLARHLRTFARHWWFAVTGRMPRGKEQAPAGRPLTFGEKRDFEALANLYRATDEAGMPERSRRPE